MWSIKTKEFMMNMIKNLKDMNRKELVDVVNNTALTSRQSLIFYERYLKGSSLFDISDIIGMSYSTTSHESSLINKKIDKYLNNR